ncbi:hypothetical protein SAY87_027307 [Trapa incisa]|uniref:Uncharacterized protein n=1 Tax=Trapa incisa TaxID=236973 RepID=A0AAN7JMH8_9MYRT|nr:hypothetical protein SAY87_027307 [Trapa incisa]
MQNSDHNMNDLVPWQVAQWRPPKNKQQELLYYDPDEELDELMNVVIYGAKLVNAFSFGQKMNVSHMEQKLVNAFSVGQMMNVSHIWSKNDPDDLMNVVIYRAKLVNALMDQLDELMNVAIYGAKLVSAALIDVALNHLSTAASLWADINALSLYDK